MTPEQALQILSNVTAQVRLTRSEHDAVKQALLTLQQIVLEKEQDNDKSSLD